MTGSEKNRSSERFRLAFAIVFLILIIFSIWHIHVKYAERISDFELIPTTMEDLGNGVTDISFDFRDAELYNQDLVFFTNHHLVEAYADDNLIYEDTQTGTFFGHTNGNK